jgi:hypothetical protein
MVGFHATRGGFGERVGLPASWEKALTIGAPALILDPV